MYVITVEFEVHAEHADSFRDEMLLQASNSLKLEEGCRHFDVAFAHDDPTKCFLYEKYDDRAAFDAHLETAHFKDFAATVAPWLKSKSVQTWKLENC